MKHEIDFGSFVSNASRHADWFCSVVHAYPMQVIAWCLILLVVRSLVYRSRS